LIGEGIGPSMHVETATIFNYQKKLLVGLGLRDLRKEIGWLLFEKRR
jgi:hypothetical protein